MNQMARNEKTLKRVGKLASKQLKSKKSTKSQKSVAGSALTQRPDRGRLGNIHLNRGGINLMAQI
jgi:hypothetical protein